MKCNAIRLMLGLFVIVVFGMAGCGGSGDNVKAASGVTPSVAAGGEHSIVLKSDGKLWAWGYNSNGQLGDGTTADSPSPILIGTGYSAIAAGWLHTIAIKSDGTLWAWGNNSAGQLGDDTTDDSYFPKQIGTGYSKIAAGVYHTVALKTDNSLWAWGNGFLGDGTASTSLFPMQIGVGFSAIAVGEGHTVALKTDGSLWAWGDNSDGQLGDGTVDQSLMPKKIGDGYSAIAAGWFHTVALKSDGSLWTWGNNSDGQLGDGSYYSSYVPVLIGTGYSKIAAGRFRTAAIKSDGSLWTWGNNSTGGLGDGTTTDSPSPILIGTGYSAISVGGWQTLGASAPHLYPGHSIAIKTDGSLLTWGQNISGQLGDGTTDDKLLPTPISVPADTIPKANTGSNQMVSTGSVVTLDGSGSSDEDGDLLTYIWTFTSKPSGSNATISDSTAVKPTFIADVAGTYVLSLVVNDVNKNSSTASSVTVDVFAPVTHAYLMTTVGSSMMYSDGTTENVTDNSYGTLTVERVNGIYKEKWTEIVNGNSITASSVEIYENNILKYQTNWTPSLKLFPSSTMTGFTETQSVSSGGLGFTNTLTVEGIETVAVTAGSFQNVLKIHIKAVDNVFVDEDYYYWFAPGIGIIKIDNATTNVVVMQLVSYVKI